MTLSTWPDSVAAARTGEVAATPGTSRAPAGSAEWWLDRLNRRLTERAGRDGSNPDTSSGMALMENYYLGRHRQTYKIRRVIESFGLRMPLFVNYCGVVVDSISERLGIDGFRFADVEAAADAAWAIWQANNLDALFKRGMRSGLIKGEFSLMVWPDAEGEPRIWVEEGSQVIVASDPETGRRRAALKRWIDEDEQAVFATVYLPDFIYKYRSGGPTGGGLDPLVISGLAWAKRNVEGEDWPLPNPLGEVPVIPFPNKPTLSGVGESEIAKVVPIQDAINANVANVMLAGLYGAFRQRTAVNVKLEVDPKTGAPVQPWNVSEDELMTAPPPRDGQPEVKFGSFEQTDLDGYIALHQALVQAIATSTRFPPHYLLGSQGVFPSGEALTAVERGISAVAGERGDDWKDPLEDAIRLALRVKALQAGLSGAAVARYEKWARMTDAEARFRNPETKSESQHVDALVKLRGGLGLPRRAVWARIPASDNEIKQWEAQLAAEEAARPAPAAQPSLAPADTTMTGTPPIVVPAAMQSTAGG
jgi:hypothetical protein